MNYRPNWGGLSGAIEELITSLRAEGFCVDIASTSGKIRDRIKAIAKIFKIAPQYDFIMATGCAYYGFLPVIIGVAAAKIYRKKVLVDFHEGHPVPFMNYFAPAIKLFLGSIPVTVASGYLLDIFKKYGFNVFLIPYHFHYEFFPKRQKQFTWNKKILWTGTFQFMYSPETALKAAQLVLKARNDVEFYFFGKGPLLQRMKNKYNNPNIKFQRFVPREELLKQYQDFSVFINTSFGDNFPLRLVEAALNELLVVSVRYGGTATIYDDKECLFFEKGNYEKLSEYILDVIEKPHLYDFFRENMHGKVMNFTWPNVRNNWLRLLLPEKA